MVIKQHIDKIKLVFFAIIAISVISYVTYKINTDFSVHSGKDHGWFYRLEYHVYLSIFFFTLMCRKPVWIPVFALAGFTTAVITVVIAMLGLGEISHLFADILNIDSGLCLQVFCCLMSITIFYLFERLLYKTQYNQ